MKHLNIIYRMVMAVAMIWPGLMISAYVLPLPVVPDTLTNPTDRASYIASRYWDGMKWDNDDLLSSEEFMGESVATFGTLLGIAGHDNAEKIVATLAENLDDYPAGLNTLAEYAYSYFYVPESPYYNEDTYRMFVNAISDKKGLTEINREKLRLHKEYLMKNRIGDMATDFTYIDTEGNARRLHQTAPAADVKILLLYDPDCHLCEEAMEIIFESEEFTRKVATGEAAVIAVNAFGQPTGGPAIGKPGIPATWTVGYSPDGEIDEQELYVIRTTPAIYMLDRENRVVAKDLTLPRLKEITGS